MLFAAGARHPTRSAAVSAAAATLGVEPEALLASLFADLPPEKRVLAPEPAPSPAELAQRANLSLVAGMLGRAVAVSIVAGSDLRSVVRVAKLRGLLCTVEAGARGRGEERLEISGPYALFRRTTMYGRALASLVPVASRCQEMELRAACVVDGAGATRTLVIRSGDPLYAGAASRRHDSKLEARFHKDFARAAPDWDVVREPAAVPAGGTLIFPDFELRHRRDPARRWLVEVMGFWTPTYVRDKLQRLGSAALDRFILCIDEERNCSAEELPASARVIRFRRHIDPVDVLRIVEP